MQRPSEDLYDCIIVGAGPAGLSAALLLGRCLRRVTVFDGGRPRNVWSHGVHGFLSRDGTSPDEVLRTAREQLEPYDTVTLQEAEVVDARRLPDAFEVTLADSATHRSRKLLVATGVVDDIPVIQGIAPLLGVSVHHCPYCDGWEHRGERLAALGKGGEAYGMALGLTVWSDDVVLCTDGPSGLADEQLERLEASDIELREEHIVRLEGTDGRLERIVLERGEPLDRDAIFFSSGQRQHSGLAAQLGCHFTEKGAVATGDCESTDVHGLFVAGDASKNVQLFVVAAAEGTLAAFAINRDLLKEDLEARRSDATVERA